MNKMGFGFLRLPNGKGGKIDYAQLNKMVDAFLAAGGTYFDTAYTYLGGKSETAIRECLVKRCDRERYQLADKLPGWQVKSHQECYEYFARQQERCGVEYFDVYLLHWLNGDNYTICERHDEFAFLRDLKARGLAKRIGFSYHGSAALLDTILTEHPETEIVQLQINYLDWDSAAIEAGKCYGIAKKHDKSIVVMEPVKGGTLANIPAEAQKIFSEFGSTDSPALWALRFAQSLEQVDVVLSGMSTLEQVAENMRDVRPLSAEEQQAVKQVAAIIESQTAIACTGCRYCVDSCPKRIAIPYYFQMYNALKRYPSDDWKIQPVYDSMAEKHGRASACISCRQCEKHCPQGLEIVDCLKEVARAFG